MEHEEQEALPQRWPTQDGADRSGSFAIIADLSPTGASGNERREAFTEAWNLSEQFRERLEEAVAESVGEVLDGGTNPRPPAVWYQIGPAAQGIPTYIVTIYEQAKDLAPVLSSLADTWAVVEVTRRVVTKLNA